MDSQGLSKASFTFTWTRFTVGIQCDCEMDEVKHPAIAVLAIHGIKSLNPSRCNE